MPQPTSTRIQIQDVEPQVDGGRYPVKASVGDRVRVGATIFRDGHEQLAGVVRSRPPGARRWRESPGAALLGLESLTVDEALTVSASDHSERVASATLTVDVDRERARFGAWYELFPRSWGGFAGVERVLPQLAELGFDVVYLPPIHPIGRTNRKGKNNTLRAGPDDPGSP